MNNLLLIKANRSFGDQIKYEIKDLFNSFSDFFSLIKEHTYDALGASIGYDITNLFFLGISALLVMLIAMKIINR